MGKNGVFQKVWVRLGLGVLVYGAVLVFLTWLMHRYWILKHVNFGDALLAVGVLACAIAAAGMMRNPFNLNFSPWGVPAFPVQDSEQEYRNRLVTEFVEQQSFGLRLFIGGLLTILVSLLVTYVIR